MPEWSKLYTRSSVSSRGTAPGPSAVIDKAVTVLMSVLTHGMNHCDV